MKITTFLVAFLLPWASSAQDSSPSDQPLKLPFILKLSPLNLINPFQQSVDILADIPLGDRWGLELGVNYVLNSGVYTSSQGETYRGFKWRPAIKYYVDRSKWGDDYISLSFKYNNIDIERYVDVWRQGLQYRETILRRQKLETWGAAFRFGSQLYMNQRKRMIIEPFFGLGIRRLRVTKDNLPPDAEFANARERWFRLRAPNVNMEADMMVGFCLGWAITPPRNSLPSK
jgi:hypothetical protein